MSCSDHFRFLRLAMGQILLVNENFYLPPNQKLLLVSLGD